MARYNDGTRYNSGARYIGEVPPNTKMATIKINADKLTLPQKLIKGQEIITKETANPNVPGNTAPLAAFATAQTALQTTVAAAEAARSSAKEATAAQVAAEIVWLDKLGLLAAFTQTATGGNATKILSAGFEVKSSRTPTPAMGVVMGVNVQTNGSPGHSKLSWTGMAGADGYLVQGSPDPITATSWTTPVISTKTKCVANGAVAGQNYWYRVAAFNAAGQGPWSAVAARPLV